MEAELELELALESELDFSVEFESEFEFEFALESDFEFELVFEFEFEFELKFGFEELTCGPISIHTGVQFALKDPLERSPEPPSRPPESAPRGTWERDRKGPLSATGKKPAWRGG